MKTDSLTVAKQRANELNQKVNLYGQSILDNEVSTSDKVGEFKQAVEIARLERVDYKHVDKMATSPIEEVEQPVMSAYRQAETSFKVLQRYLSYSIQMFNGSLLID